MRRADPTRLHDGSQFRGERRAARPRIDRAIAGPTRVKGPRVGSRALAAWNGVRVGHWLFAMGRVGQVTEVEEAGVVVLLAASLFRMVNGWVRKRKIRELLTTTDLVRLRCTSPPKRLDTVTLESEGIVSIEHDELGAAQELERRLRRRWGRADGESESEVVYHGTSHSGKPPSDHAAIPRSVDLLGYGAHYLSKMSLAAHALVHGELFEDSEVARATPEAGTLAA